MHVPLHSVSHHIPCNIPNDSSNHILSPIYEYVRLFLLRQERINVQMSQQASVLDIMITLAWVSYYLSYFFLFFIIFLSYNPLSKNINHFQYQYVTPDTYLTAMLPLSPYLHQMNIFYIWISFRLYLIFQCFSIYFITILLQNTYVKSYSNNSCWHKTFTPNTASHSSAYTYTLTYHIFRKDLYPISISTKGFHSMKFMI